jgi:hypothetical protein
MSPKPPDDGFDIDNFAYSEFASALEGEHPLSSVNTDNEMESEILWTPARRFVFFYKRHVFMIWISFI